MLLLRHVLACAALAARMPRRALLRMGASPSFEPLPGFVSAEGSPAGGLPAIAPGIVLVAAPDNYDHYFCESLVLVLEHDGEKGSRGVLLNHETPWCVPEMNEALTQFNENLVFLGGDRGADTMLMLHADASLPGAQPVGSGGLHRGGLAAAIARVSENEASPENFKFFYKVSEWLPGMLEREVRQGLWSPIELPLTQILDRRGPRSMWQLIRDQRLLKPASAQGQADMQRRTLSVPSTTSTVMSARSSMPAGVATVQSESMTTMDSIDDSSHQSAIEAVMAFRRFMGNDQWLVRWRGYDSTQDTWETRHVIEAEASGELWAEAERFRQQQTSS